MGQIIKINNQTTFNEYDINDDTGIISVKQWKELGDEDNLKFGDNYM